MKNLKLALVAVLSSLVTIGTASVALADNMRVSGLNGHSGLNMRSGPGTAYGVVATMPSNARHINWTCRTRRSAGGGVWYQVDWQGRSGWASSRYLRYMPNSHRHCTTQQPRAGVVQGHGGQTIGHGHVHVRPGHGHTHRHGQRRHSHQHQHLTSRAHNSTEHRGGNHGRSSYRRGCTNMVIGHANFRFC